jgi:SanA protein
MIVRTVTGRTRRVGRAVHAWWTRQTRARKVLLVAVTAVGGGFILPNCWIGLSASGHIYTDAKSVPERTVAIVPGAAVWRNRRPSSALRYRLEAAVALYEAGRVGRVLVSGDHGQRNYNEVGVMRRWLVDAGVPEDRVYMDHAGFRTLDTAARARAVFHVEDAVICTQGFHLPRAVFLARMHDIDAVGFEARAYLGHGYRDQFRELLARVRAVADVVFGTEPRFYGPPVPITGPASASW